MLRLRRGPLARLDGLAPEANRSSLGPSPPGLRLRGGELKVKVKFNQR